MALEFFKNFPEIDYKLSNGKTILIKDFFRKSKVEQEALNSIVEYSLYELADGERPDVAAAKLYGNPHLHWTFFLVNEHLHDGYRAWPMTQESLQDYISTVNEYKK